MFLSPALVLHTSMSLASKDDDDTRTEKRQALVTNLVLLADVQIVSLVSSSTPPYL